jgi:thioredoxin reductase
MLKENTADVIIVGGGPAGLSCAMLLGRSCRKVMVFDSGEPRNKQAKKMHGFLSRDGENPLIFLDKARKELKKYHVRFIRKKIINVSKAGNIFKAVSSDGNTFFSKKILLATGLSDILPDIEGIRDFYGKSVFHCPYCDGWEFRDQPWVVIAKGRNAAVELALRFKSWTNDITLLSSYVKDMRKGDLDILIKNEVRIEKGRIKKLKGSNGKLQAVILNNGKTIPAKALFFSTGHTQQSGIANQLGCKCNRKGLIRVDKLQQTNVPGLYVAGDTAWDMQMVIIAAAEGAKAGIAINSALNLESRK